MSTRVLNDPNAFRPVIQLSIHADNKVGRLNEIVGFLKSHDVHIIAISILDTTDSSLIRVIVDYPEEAQHILDSNNFSYVSTEMVAVELNSEADIAKVTFALVQAEINIHYIYPFVIRPNNRSALAISLEDNDLASETLRRHQINVLSQNDIAR
jgi:hypothetical protein